MHLLGNDFVVIDALQQNFKPSGKLIRQWANRQRGIGFDQLLLIEKPRPKSTHFYYRIFNADGNEVAQCGNGALCVAKFLLEKKLCSENTIHLMTMHNLLELNMEASDQVPLDDLGTYFNQHPHPYFPQGSNVEFMKIRDPKQIDLRIYERGVGETQACGSGACAAVIAGHLLNRLAKKVNVKLPGGLLTVRWEGEGFPVFLRGNPAVVFQGVIDYP
ncbi:hypothetical protein FQR65_LT18398 [Abscondita terminalis]|nr:hypothetical protein FQR65_LT18398 [Abscondita terminalis]